MSCIQAKVKRSELNHPNHTLVTYPDLGHVLYPSSEWVTSFGPIPQYVLAALYAWPKAHSGLSYPYFTPATSTIYVIMLLVWMRD